MNSHQPGLQLDPLWKTNDCAFGKSGSQSKQWQRRPAGSTFKGSWYRDKAENPILVAHPPPPPVIWEELSQDPCISQFSHSCDLISDKKQVKEGRKGYFDPSLRMQSIMMRKAWHGREKALSWDYSLLPSSTEPEVWSSQCRCSLGFLPLKYQ